MNTREVIKPRGPAAHPECRELRMPGNGMDSLLVKVHQVYIYSTVRALEQLVMAILPLIHTTKEIIEARDF